MKKSIITLSSFVMLSGNIAVAQQLAEETTLENEFLNFIPTSYTKNGQIIFYSANTKDKESGLFKNLQVYNEGFEKIKDIKKSLNDF